MINHRKLNEFKGDPSWIHKEIVKAIKLTEEKSKEDITLREFVEGCMHLIFSLALITAYDKAIGYEVSVDFKTTLTNFHDIIQHIISKTVRMKRRGGNGSKKTREGR